MTSANVPPAETPQDQPSGEQVEALVAGAANTVTEREQLAGATQPR